MDAGTIKDGLQHYWKLDEEFTRDSQDPKAEDSEGSLDIYPHNVLGTKKGRIYRSTNFDDDGYISAFNDVRYDTFTYVCWIWTDDEDNNKTVVIGSGPSHGDGNGPQWRIENSNFKQVLNKQNVALIGESDSGIERAKWQLIGCSYDADTGEVRFYKQGEYDGGGTNSVSWNWNDWQIGYDDDTASPSEGLIADLSDMAVWDRVLSDNEHRWLFNHGGGRRHPFKTDAGNFIPTMGL